MRLITEAEVAAVLDLPGAIATLRAAFAQHGRGQAQVLGRTRAAMPMAGAAMALSTMGALLDADGDLPAVLGSKVYSARDGRYHFVITLYAAETGAPLAVLEGNEFTRLRTAAASAVAVDLLAPAATRTLAIIGGGIQGRVHAEVLCRMRRFERLLVCARSGASAMARELQAKLGLPVSVVDMAEAAGEADVLVTATRSAEPLFDGRLVKPGTLVVAVGSSTPVARELDDALLARAALIAVEWRPAAADSGEFALAAPGVIRPECVVELGELIAQPRARTAQDLVVYKSVGIGLEDVALARLVCRRLGVL